MIILVASYNGPYKQYMAQKDRPMDLHRHINGWVDVFETEQLFRKVYPEAPEFDSDGYAEWESYPFMGCSTIIVVNDKLTLQQTKKLKDADFVLTSDTACYVQVPDSIVDQFRLAGQLEAFLAANLQHQVVIATPDAAVALSRLSVVETLARSQGAVFGALVYLSPEGEAF